MTPHMLLRGVARNPVQLTPHVITRRGIDTVFCPVHSIDPDGYGKYAVVYQTPEGTLVTRNLGAGAYVYFPDLPANCSIQTAWELLGLC